MIHPKDVTKYTSNNPIITKIINRIIPSIKSKEINFFIVPLPLSDNGMYWTDYAHSYLTRFYGDDHDENDFIRMVIYLNNDLTINYEREILLSYELDIKNQQTVYDTFRKHLPYNYVWSGNQLEVMRVEYKKRNKPVPKKTIKQIEHFKTIHKYLSRY